MALPRCFPCFKRSERGAALVEFAIVSLLLVFFIYAIAAFGIILSTKNSMTNAAAEAARSALSVSDLPSATLDTRRLAQVDTSVSKALDALGSNKTYASVSRAIAACDPSNPADTTKCITVTITYPYSSHPLIPAAPGLHLVTPSSIKTTAVVRLS